MNCSDFNRMLDSYIDGELDASARAELESHAAQCSDCRERLAASEQLREILSHMDDDISVPLPAQAAWRNAVRAEAKRMRMKRVFAAVGAVAAVCVFSVGVTAMLRQNPEEGISPSIQRIETDGVSEEAAFETDVSMMSAKARSMDYIDRTIAVEDVTEACDYLADVIAEYGGMVERETEGDERKIYVQVSGENAADFISAVDSLGISADQDSVAVDESAAMIGVCVIITVA